METKMFRIGIAAVALLLVGAGCSKANKPTVEETTPTEPDTTVEEQMEEHTQVVASGMYTVATEASTVEWFGKKRVGGSHAGTISIASGEVTFGDGGAFEGGNFTIDMTTIKPYDDIEQLLTHLESADFFDVANHGEATFVMTSATHNEGTAYTVVGDLTIKGITQEITFPATIETESGEVRATAQFVVDRSLFDVRFGSESFFENLGDAIVENDMEFTLELVATPKELIMEGDADSMMEEVQ